MNVREVIKMLEQDRSMKCIAIMEKGPKSWGAYVPDVPGCAAAGESRDEVIQLIKQAIEFHLEGLQAEGAPVPQPRSEIEYITGHLLRVAARHDIDAPHNARLLQRIRDIEGNTVVAQG